MSYPTLAELQARGFAPRVHPNGFLQLDLDQTGRQRLHIWSDQNELPRQGSDNSIHDHIFDMTSRVLCGQMINVAYEYQATDDGEMAIWQAAYQGQESVLQPTPTRMRRLRAVRSIMQAGHEYHYPAGSFHATETIGLTATMMTKTTVYNQVARILVPVGQVPDNSFLRSEVDPDSLWRLIARASQLWSS